MKVMNALGNVVEMLPREAFKPEAYTRDMGRFEAVEAKADKACEAIGRLLALLYEKKLLTLDECLDVSDNAYDVIQR